jgi:hypothetical protein
MKKVSSYLLMGIVVIVTVVSILAIWDVIELERVFWKTSQSLFVVFIAAVVILFISSVVINNNDKRKTD